MASRTRRSFNTGNPTRLVRKEQPDRSPFKIELVARDGLTQWFSAEDWPAHADRQGNSYLQQENATLDADLLEEYLQKATGLRVRRT